MKTIIKTKILKEIQLEVNGYHGIDSGTHLELKVDGEEVEIFPPARDDMDGYMLQWRVVWCGAVDFEGNKKEMLSRYPEFKALKSYI